MRTNQTLRNLILISIFAYLLIGCSKEDETKGPTPDPFVKELVDEVNADTLEKNVQWLQDMGTRFALADNRKEVAKKIKERFIQYGCTNTTLDSFFITKSYSGIVYNTWQYNVVATIEGIEYPDSICIMGGHYDSIIQNSVALNTAPGANDNASGVAAALEVARVINKNEFTPKTTLKFIAFGAEELGLFGSYDYATKLYNDQKKVKMMLNNDMIAYWPLTESGMRVNIIDYPNSIDLRLSAEKACELYTTIQTYNNNRYQAYSDSYPFFLKGYEAIFFISNADDPNYHTLNDIVGYCNFNFCREVTNISCALIIENNML